MPKFGVCIIMYGIKVEKKIFHFAWSFHQKTKAQYIDLHIFLILCDIMMAFEIVFMNKFPLFC